MSAKLSGYKIIFILIFLFSGIDLLPDNLPLGGKTASMGGAGSAFCEDSASPYINPAGVSRVSGNILSLSTSLYVQSIYQINDFFIPNGVDNSTFGSQYNYDQDYLASLKFAAFPGTLSYFYHLGSNHVISFSVIVPTYERMNFNGRISIDFPGASPAAVSMDTAQTYIFERTEYYFGPSYGIALGNLRLGVSLFALYRNFINSAESTSLSLVGPYFIDSKTTGFGEGSTWGLAGTAGVQYNLGNFAVGASIFIPTINLTGEFKNSGRTNLSQSDDLGFPDEVEIERGEGSIGYHKPVRLRIGLAYEKGKSWAAALDFEISFATNRLISRDMSYTTTTYIQGSGVTETEETDNSNSGAALAFSVYCGGEKFINKSWALRMGMFYSPSTVEEFNKTIDEILTMRIHRVGGTVGLANMKEFGEVAFGLSFTYGIGETVTGDVYSDLTVTKYEKVNVNYYEIAVFVSGDVDFSRL